MLSSLFSSGGLRVLGTNNTINGCNVSGTANGEMTVRANGVVAKIQGPIHSLRCDGQGLVINGKRYTPGEAFDNKNAWGANVQLAIAVTGGAQEVSTEAGTITVTGDVSGSVKTASGDIAIHQGSVKGNVSSMSGNVTVEGGGVGGSASSMSGNVTVGGEVKGAATSISGVVRKRPPFPPPPQPKQKKQKTVPPPRVHYKVRKEESKKKPPVVKQSSSDLVKPEP